MKLRLLLTLAAGAITCSAGSTEPTSKSNEIGVSPRLLRRRGRTQGSHLALAEISTAAHAWGQEVQDTDASEAWQQGFAAAAPAPAPGPGGAAPPALPAITQATCADLKGKVSAVDCSWFNFGAGMGVGCSCAVPTSSCPPAPDMEKLGFTGVMSASPISVPGMGGLVRTTCFYQQWLGDPALSGPLKQWQSDYANARTVEHITQAFQAAEQNAEKAAEPLWAGTPMPWLEAHPTTPHPMFSPSPGPAPMLPLWDPTVAAQALAAQAALMMGMGGAPSPGGAPAPGPAPFR